MAKLDGKDVSELLAKAKQLHQTGKISQAKAAYKNILLIKPDMDAAFLLATIYGQQKNYKMAINYFKQVVQIDPKAADAHYNLGYAYFLFGDFSASVACYDKALLLTPQYLECLHNRGTALQELGKHEEAIKSFSQALEIDPATADSLFLRGMSYFNLKRFNEALEDLNAAIKLNKEHVNALIGRGRLYLDQNDFTLSLASFKHAISIEPENAAAHYQCARALEQLSRLNVAAEAYHNAFELDATNDDALYGYARLMTKLKTFEKAIPAYERLIKLSPHIMYKAQYFTTKASVWHWHNYDKSLNEILTSLAKGRPNINPFQVLSLVDSLDVQRNAAHSFAHLNYKAGSDTHDFDLRQPGEKIRIGYFSEDFQMHPVAIQLAGLLEAHDRSKFELFGFSAGSSLADEKPDSDHLKMRARLAGALDHFHDVSEQSNEDVVQLMRDNRIHIAIDLGGYTNLWRSRIFADRVAPVQINFLGFSGTMGVDYMDYIIGDTTLVPPENKHKYSEKIIHLPHSFMPNDNKRHVVDQPLNKSAYNLPQDSFVFCCFNNQYKITPPVLDRWAQIMLNVEKSVLWLSASHPDAMLNLRKEARKRGVNADRIIFASHAPTQADYLTRLAHSDLFLDTLPYNAHSTGCDALWAGVPILTLQGEGFTGRVASSLLAAVGLPELIASSEREYIDLAISLATDPARMGQLRKKLEANRFTAPLFDTPRYARNFEAGLAAALERYRDNLSPDDIYVSG